MRYRIHPDDDLVQDTVYFLMFLFFTFIIILVTLSSTYSDSDECANSIRDHLSPYQIAQMIEADNTHTTYDDVKSWCDLNIETWSSEIDHVKRTYIEYPTRPDMIID